MPSYSLINNKYKSHPPAVGQNMEAVGQDYKIRGILLVQWHLLK